MEKKQIFEGIKIVDFSWVGVGPQVARELAEHGAKVVRVESHTNPETLRLAGPFKDSQAGIDRSAFGTAYNTNKYGMALNLKKEGSSRVTERLIKWADVITDSMTPGSMGRLGLDYESCKKIKPDIIYYSTTQAGQYGPWSTFAGYGQQGASVTGFYDLIGWADRPPSSAPTAITDFIAPWFLAIALIAALDYKRRTGEGRYIEQSQWETGLHFLGPWLLDYKINNRVLSRDGNRDPRFAPHAVFACQGDNRYVAVAVENEDQWQAFCGVIDSPDWCSEERFSSMALRKQNENELESLIAEWAINQKAEDVMENMQSAGVPAGVVGGGGEGDMFEDPQLKHRKHFRLLEHPEIGVHNYNAPSYILSKTPNHIHKAGPTLGEDNEYIYMDLLGFTDDDIGDLYAEGVITTEFDVPETGSL